MGKVAECQEVDSDGQEIGPISYARSIAPGSPKKKERPNTSKSRQTTPDDSEPESAPTSTKRGSKMRKEERRSSGKAKVVGSKEPRRPSARTSKTTGSVPYAMPDDPSYYGARQEVASRPRSRPRSETFAGPGHMIRPPRQAPGMQYHSMGGPPPPQRPPYSQYPPGGAFPGSHSWGGPPALYPQHPMAPPPPRGIPGGPPPLPAPPPSSRSHAMSHRPERPASASGFRGPGSFEPDRSMALGRRISMSRKASKDHEDRIKMPPPPPARPYSAHPSNSSAFRPPPAQKPPQLSFREAAPSKRRSRKYEDYDFEGEAERYHPVGRRASHHYDDDVFDDDDEDDDEDSDLDIQTYRREQPASRRARGASVYDSGGGVGGLTDKIRRMSIHQDRVNGSHNAAMLTADALRKVRHGNASSRSTQSSASRDESDYRHSATTRTTRSGPNGEDITIKVPRGAVVEVGGAKITCRDGGDLNFPRGNESRGASDREWDQTVIDDEDDDDEFETMTRADHAMMRPRASSKRRSYSRGIGYPGFEPGYEAPAYYPPSYGYQHQPFDYSHHDY